MGKLHFIVSLLLLLGLVAVSDFGEAASITLVPTGAATYSITATDLQESAGIELSIVYDRDALGNPTVKYGAMTAGALPASNISVPGSVRIVFITTGVIKGSGELASITFVSKGKAQAWQPTFSSPPGVIDAKGSPLAVQSVATASPYLTEANSEATTVKSSSDSSSGGMVTALSTATSVTTQSGMSVVSNMTLPQSGDQAAPREEPGKQSVPAESVVVSRASTPSPGEEVAVPPKVKAAGVRSTTALKSVQSVPEQFRTYKEIRTITRLSTLFERKALAAAGIIQTPDIVVTDGESLVTVAIELTNEVDTPSFSLKGANMKSIRQMSDTKWELDALPQRDKSDVRLSIILGDERTEISLVAVPPINKTGTLLLALSDAALDDRLAKPLTNSKPAYDMNSDGKQDYLDDYILVAHWLLKQKLSVKKDDKILQLPVKNGSSR
jgi:hypothetical protein